MAHHHAVCPSFASTAPAKPQGRGFFTYLLTIRWFAYRLDMQVAFLLICTTLAGARPKIVERVRLTGGPVVC